MSRPARSQCASMIRADITLIFVKSSRVNCFSRNTNLKTVSVLREISVCPSKKHFQNLCHLGPPSPTASIVTMPASIFLPITASNRPSSTASGTGTTVDTTSPMCRTTTCPRPSRVGSETSDLTVSLNRSYSATTIGSGVTNCIDISASGNSATIRSFTVWTTSITMRSTRTTCVTSPRSLCVTSSRPLRFTSPYSNSMCLRRSCPSPLCTSCSSCLLSSSAGPLCPTCSSVLRRSSTPYMLVHLSPYVLDVYKFRRVCFYQY